MCPTLFKSCSTYQGGHSGGHELSEDDDYTLSIRTQLLHHKPNLYMDFTQIGKVQVKNTAQKNSKKGE